MEIPLLRDMEDEGAQNIFDKMIGLQKFAVNSKILLRDIKYIQGATLKVDFLND